jgi:hypothetical protein
VLIVLAYLAFVWLLALVAFPELKAMVPERLLHLSYAVAGAVLVTCSAYTGAITAIAVGLGAVRLFLMPLEFLYDLIRLISWLKDKIMEKIVYRIAFWLYNRLNNRT